MRQKLLVPIFIFLFLGLFIFGFVLNYYSSKTVSQNESTKQLNGDLVGLPFETFNVSLPVTHSFESFEILNDKVVVYENKVLYIHDLRETLSYKLVNVSRAFSTNFGVFFVYNDGCYNLFKDMKVKKVECSKDEVFIFSQNQSIVTFNKNFIKFGAKNYEVPFWRDEKVGFFKILNGYIFILHSSSKWNILIMVFDEDGNLLWKTTLEGDLVHYQFYNSTLFINIGSTGYSLPKDYGLYKISINGITKITDNYECYPKFEFEVYNNSIWIANHYEVVACSFEGEPIESFYDIKQFVTKNTVSDFGWHGLIFDNYLLISAKDAVLRESIYFCKYPEKCNYICTSVNRTVLIELTKIDNKIVLAYSCGSMRYLRIFRG